MNGYYDSANYDGLTDEEIAAMRKDTERDMAKAGSKPIWTSKTKLGYTPIFIGKSGALYVGGVKLEGVYFAENRQSSDGFNKLCIVFETDKVVDMREKDRFLDDGGKYENKQTSRIERYSKYDGQHRL